MLFTLLDIILTLPVVPARLLQVHVSTLGQTQKLKCVAICKAQEALLTSNNNHGVSPHSPVPFLDIDMDASPIPFEGDFYGDYSPDFFDGDGGTPTPPSSDSDSDSDSDFNEPEAESWEPLPHTNTLSHVVGASGSNDDVSGADAPNANASAAGRVEERCVIEAKTARKTFVVRYPSKLAGAPIPKMKSIASTNDSYSSQLHSDNADNDNPYAPFASKLDWEIACWAKLHGPGSTAFTDLLAIEEVSLPVVSAVCASSG